MHTELARSQRSGGRALRRSLDWAPLLKPVCLAVLLAAAPSGWALPQGGVAVSGQVALRSPQPSTLEILQTSAKAGLDWQSFSIAAGERVLIRQPDASSVLFNRVLGADPSLIFGQLQANGRVFLSNPRGIIFGAGSQVDVGSLVATTLAVNSSVLANGNYQLSGATAETGELRADGEIRAPGGTVALVSPRLSVGGNVLAGRVGLAAVAAVQVDVDGDGLIFFNARNDQLDARLSLLPSAELRGGSAELRAVARSGFADTVLNLEGVVRARGLGLRGGQVVIDGGPAGITRLAGSVQAGRADGSRGGDVVVLGDKVLVEATARIDASGETAGGQVRLGGDFQGKNLALQNAQQVIVQPGAQINADATRLGEGGRVIVWSDSATRFAGQASVRGGPGGGDGGLVEVSSHGFLAFAGSADRSAAAGRAGLLLLDPTSLDVVADGTAGAQAALVSGTFGFAAGAANSTLTASAVTNQLALGSVTLQATQDLTVAAEIKTTVATSGALTLQAGRDVIIAAPITLAGTGKALTLSSNSATGVVGAEAVATGVVKINSALQADGKLIVTRNPTGTGAHEFNAAITADSLEVTGDIKVNGNHAWTLASASSLAGQISDGAAVGGVLKAGGGTLTLSGANSYSGGLSILAGTLQVGAGGTTGSITGDVANAGALVFNRTDAVSFGGVVSGSGSLTQAGSGALTLAGANSYTGGTTISAGTLQIGAGGTTGAIAGNVANAGALVFNRSDAVSFGGVVSGVGSLTQAGSSTLSLTGDNT